jgi:fumarate reductase subunit C
MSSPFVMIMHVGAISVQTRPLQRFCSVDFIGPPCLQTLVLIALHVSVVRNSEYFKEKYDAPQSHIDSRDF